MVFLMVSRLSVLETSQKALAATSWMNRSKTTFSPQSGGWFFVRSVPSTLTSRHLVNPHSGAASAGLAVSEQQLDGGRCGLAVGVENLGPVVPFLVPLPVEAA